MKNRISLRGRLQLLVAIALAPGFLIVSANLMATKSLRLEELDAYSLRMSEILQHEVVRGLTAAAVLVVAAGKAPVLASAGNGCESYLGAVARELPTVVDIAVADPDGRIYCKSGESFVDDLERITKELMPTAVAQQIAVGKFAATPRGATLPIGSAIRDDGGVVRRFVVITVALTELERLVAARGDLPGNRAIVADIDGTVLLRYPTSAELKAGDPLPAIYQSLATAQAPGTTWLGTDDQTRRIVSYQPMTTGVPISFLFEIPAEGVMAPINRAMLINSLVALAVTILALSLASWYGRKFIRVPVDQILAVLAARRSGDARARTHLGRGASEFANIGHSIDQLFDELDQKDSDQRLLEDQRDTFARELQHRVKNLLAIIQVIARQTLSARSTSPAVHEFERRIHALIRANTALLSDRDKVGELGPIIKDTLTPFLAEDDERVTLTGPGIQVGAKVGLALTMAIHEMATNAAKYGALSSPEGTITITWMLDDDRFLLSWVEAGGPAADTPAPGGFGTLMIKRVLEAETKGSVLTSFPRGGFQFHLTAPRAALHTQ